MKMIKYFLFAQLLVLAAEIAGEIEISDKIDFGSVASTEFSSSKGAPIVFTIEDSSHVINPTRSFKQSSDFRNDGVAFRERDSLKPKRRQSNCASTPDSSPLKVVNNIRVIVDDNGPPFTPKNYDNCENNVCDVTVSTIKDIDGNLVTTLQLNIITKMRDIKVDDIPVIDGVSGSLPDDGNPHYNRPHFGSSNVPQIFRHDSNHFYPSFGVPKNNFFRPSAMNPYYLYANARHGDESQGQGHSRWLTGRDGIDDKIDVPLSETSSQ